MQCIFKKLCNILLSASHHALAEPESQTESQNCNQTCVGVVIHDFVAGNIRAIWDSRNEVCIGKIKDTVWKNITMNIYIDAAIAGAPEQHGELAGRSKRSPVADWHENWNGDFGVEIKQQRSQPAEKELYLNRYCVLKKTPAVSSNPSSIVLDICHHGEVLGKCHLSSQSAS